MMGFFSLNMKKIGINNSQLQMLKTCIIVISCMIFIYGCKNSLPNGLLDNQYHSSPEWSGMNPQHDEMFSVNSDNCKACHGQDLNGGQSGISCLVCHHDREWNDESGHGTAFANKSKVCKGCHGQDLDGGLADRSCLSCHHNGGWSNESEHGSSFAGNPKACRGCHGQDLDGGLADRSCLSCHHNGGWSDISEHGDEYSDNPNTCKACHGDDEDDGLVNLTCKSCHHNVWDESHGAQFISRPENCKLCHGEDLNGANTGASCVSCHHNWGTPSNPQHGIEYVKVRGICDSCHGVDHKGGLVDKSCIDCHHSWAPPLEASGHISQFRDNSDTCLVCHADGGRSDCGICHGKSGTHATHISSSRGPSPGLECETCHNAAYYPEFVDSGDLDGTHVCDPCHSPDGAFDGVNDASIGAKLNWVDGVYDGNELKAGKGKWCAGCHDDAPAFSQQSLYEIILDDPDADFDPYLAPPEGYPQGVPTFDPPEGNPAIQWTYWWGFYQEYGNGFLYTEAQDGGTRTVTWTPDLPDSGEYSVYAWWTSHSNRVTNAKYTINHETGSTTVEVNQEQNGGEWNYLGTYSFVSGSSGSVVLTNDSDEAGQYIIADAVKFMSGDPGSSAPNVIGGHDSEYNKDYGFYSTGHKIECTRCHDISKKHIDHEHRTYKAALKNYIDGYRLGGYMKVPLPAGSVGINRWTEAGLCFECHNPYEVLGTSSSDLSHSNFLDLDGSHRNLHYYHYARGSTSSSDSDYDGILDSAITCITCHNVHGAKNSAMIKSGELISDPGTTNKTPALDFTYYEVLPEATVSYAAPIGTYYVYGWWFEASNRFNNVQFTINHAGGTDTINVNQLISNRSLGQGIHNGGTNNLSILS
ncbi:MAG: hypothetical protein SVZ03_04990, partial [Spirochaetota bacterium]|nr:hypothetical protein [Spirochaetota bacterium]